jgi:hypothetical protein
MTISKESVRVRLVARALLAWSVFVVAVCGYYITDGSPAGWVGVGVAALTAAVAWWGTRRGLWVEPLLATHYLLAFGCIVAGAVTGIDLYVVGGLVCLTVLGVGVSILARLAPPTPDPKAVQRAAEEAARDELGS